MRCLSSPAYYRQHYIASILSGCSIPIKAMNKQETQRSLRIDQFMALFAQHLLKSSTCQGSQSKRSATYFKSHDYWRILHKALHLHLSQSNTCLYAEPVASHVNNSISISTANQAWASGLCTFCSTKETRLVGPILHIYLMHSARISILGTIPLVCSTIFNACNEGASNSIKTGSRPF